MLRLDLKDENETVLFVEPYKGGYISIHKAITDGNRIYVEAFDHISYVTYESEESRDEAYEYILNKVNDYLFPQVADFSSIPFEISDN